MSTSVVSEASGERIFVIGDIHGCLMECDALLHHLEKNEALTDDDIVIFLGDYIDRGSDSDQVLGLLIEFKTKFPNSRFLKGNHEDMLLDFLGFGGRLGSSFLYNGGLETIQSYGVSVFSPTDEMVASIPKSHLDFVQNLDSILVIEDYICVHAGLDPNFDLFDQEDRSVLWIRDEFIEEKHDFEKTVLFGHTPHKEIYLDDPYKIGLDTGLVFGHKLSCLELREGTVHEVQRGKVKVKTSKLEGFKPKS